jgi:uncharacterized protein YfaP (DUF2135 family)
MIRPSLASKDDDGNPNWIVVDGAAIAHRALLHSRDGQPVVACDAPVDGWRAAERNDAICLVCA